jgi:hypothetical protein
MKAWLAQAGCTNVVMESTDSYWQNSNPPPRVEASHGLLSCWEWTGVSLGLVLCETGLLPEAQ